MYSCVCVVGVSVIHGVGQLKLEIAKKSCEKLLVVLDDTEDSLHATEPSPLHLRTDRCQPKPAQNCLVGERLVLTTPSTSVCRVAAPLRAVLASKQLQAWSLL